jgi:REP element-mobilizing transposase RayT
MGEKKPRLQATTFVDMRNHEKFPQEITQRNDNKFHLVWITKYRKPVLLGDIAIRVRELIREICRGLEVEIIKGHVSKDHVHLFVSISQYH